MSILWPEKVLHNKVLLYVTDAAPYMIKSGKALKVFYPKLTHIKFMAHGLLRVSEAIRDKFPKVDVLESHFFVLEHKKNIFKSPCSGKYF